VARLGNAAKMPFAIHPHMLRHACGFKLANDGHDTRALQHYLGRAAAGKDLGKLLDGKRLSPIANRLKTLDKGIVRLYRFLNSNVVRRRQSDLLQQPCSNVMHIGAISE
jgi:hypothetical protein